ncbi:MAG TPA: methylated-DNA--[protein]-cysteine S-methyltransferase [Verrucomicrobiae bacterium]|jgi:methylated-DNA-[protein]-cysteine S-methyltransferase|nr:methylated-DNA--[protein]-cysteine S-methyltransferase [Verrucomicrobiae bacterium]
MTRYTEMESSIGALVLAGEADGVRLSGLRLIWLPGGSGKFRPEPDWVKDAKPFAETIRQLREYFAGKRDAFDLPLAPEGTEFQQEVWRAVAAIPYGETRSYGEIARQIGKADAVRAVGAANGQNPLPIVIPCHRVIGSDGRLTGYGGGLPLKKRLLALESRQRALL